MKVNYNPPTIDILIFDDEDVIVNTSETAVQKLMKYNDYNNHDNYVEVEWTNISPQIIE